MAFPNALYKVTWGGTIYNGADIWSNGIHLAVVGSDVPTSIEIQENINNLMAGNVGSWFPNQYAWISDNAQLEWVKTARLDEQGIYTQDSSLSDYDTPIVGADSRNTAPQLSTVITLDTGARRGLAKTGRIYPPLSGFVGDDGSISDGLPQQMADTFADFVIEVNSEMAPIVPGLVVVVASKQGAGLVRPVTGVRVGSVQDTQRSRRNAFLEEYFYSEV